MPKFIGRTIPSAQIADPMLAQSPERARLTYSQARLCAAAGVPVIASLDTSDRGSKGSLAKRWYRWFAPPAAILALPAATRAMRARAHQASAS